MIVYYDNKTSERLRSIVAVEHEVMTPTIPADMNIGEQVKYYNEIGMEFISLNYEMGGAIFDYNVCVDDNGIFIGLQPK